ncbi:MAG: GDP-L-fucose synthase [Deltaproteobacteria bacterium]|nr:GDP-L-fucose synthase [Deltaproteobacteria bacterium]
MKKDEKIYVAGHRGLVGSSLMSILQQQGYTNILTRTHAELDLTNQAATEAFFEHNRPKYVFLAAAKVGGIIANNTYKAEFIYENLTISANIIQAAHKFDVTKLLNLGSSCIYPRQAPQPLKEEYLLSGPLEPTNEPYAIAKIAAIKLCRYYNEQYGSNFMSVMPTNMYGPFDNFDLETSHVMPAMLRKFHLAKLATGNDNTLIQNDIKTFGPLPSDIAAALDMDVPAVTLWGSGSVYREFMYVADLAQACVFLMQNFSAGDIGEFINIGTGKDITIKELAQTIKQIVGYDGEIHWDSEKPDGTPRKLLDIRQAKELGWEPRYDLTSGLKLYYQWYCKHSNCPME